MLNDSDNLRPSELKNLLGELGEKAEKTPKAKTVVLEEVLAEQKRKTRNMLLALGIGAAVTLILFYFAYLKYMSNFQ